MRISDWSSDVCSSDLLSGDGERIAIGTDWTGTRDRSWGIRPVGASEPQPPPEGNFNQFFWLWTPCNFADRSLFFHSNDDGDGHPWNRRAVIVGDVAGKGGAEQHLDGAAFAVQWAAGPPRLARLDTDPGGGSRLTPIP